MAIPRPSRARSKGSENGYRRVLAVTSLARSATCGWVRLGSLALPCALGRTGRRATKREGDGATPIGQWRLVRVLYRPDRLRRPQTGLPVRALHSSDGWCDHVGDRNYNRHVAHPYPASAERLWRDDELYDVIVVLDHNMRPRIQGGGSAIFMHLARPSYTPTEGCIALARRDMLLLLAQIGRGAQVTIG